MYNIFIRAHCPTCGGDLIQEDVGHRCTEVRCLLCNREITVLRNARIQVSTSAMDKGRTKGGLIGTSA